MRRPAPPGWKYELKAREAGCALVAGMDEVGRGCLAGPVVAAAVILEPGQRFDGLHDSKLLTQAQREMLFRVILRKAEAWGIGAVDAEEIDHINILNATREAMRRAVAELSVTPDHLLIDALRLPGLPIAQTSVIHGDRLCVSIAAASVIAKVVRDRVMEHYDRMYPGFGFAAHKGYATAEHIAAVERQGPSPLHRRSFRGVWQQRTIQFS